MTITPGSLDYLYYNGVLDHIPYEAYEMGPVVANSQQTGFTGLPPLGSLKQSILGDNNYNSVTNQTTNTSDYLNSAMKGEMYGYYGNSNDSFTRTTNSSINQSGNYSQSAQMFGTSNGYGGLNGSASNMSIANGNGYLSPAQGMNGYDLGVQSEDYPKYSLFNNRGYGNRQANYDSSNRNKGGFGKALLTMLAATGAIVGGIFLLSKGKPAEKTTIWQDLRNWFKNNNIGAKLNPKNWIKNHPNFWAKLNPKNWVKNHPNFWAKLNPKNWIKKKPSAQNQTKTSFWAKLNPKNWGKKNTNTANTNKTGNFWSKLNPKNWFKKKG